MAFDPGLAERLREALLDAPDINEKKIFGGLAFMSHGYMFIGIAGDTLMARVEPEHYDEALARPHVRVMDFTGRPLRGYVYVDPPGIGTDAELLGWMRRCRRFVDSLPARVR
ncbi:MAG TPA: TfoX/Sxy family protein [Dokdonella sp.]|jgi:hypothetical protein|nr:TfoX/Sxy family protein [Dokdonella sp.]